MGKLFSVCIPTYCRAKFLRNNLEALYQQFTDDLAEQVEILVSNNCSPDETDSVVKEYIGRGLPIRYFCNEENIGADSNFLQCIREASGKYVLLLGDDDLLLQGALETLVRFLGSGDYGLVYITGVGYGERDRVRATTYDEIHRTSVVYEDRDAFLRRVSYYITFMSGNIFNKSLLPDFDAEAYRDTNFMQVPFFLHAMVRAEKNAYLDGRFLATGGNGDNNGGYGLYQVFGVNLFRILQSFEGNGVRPDTVHAIANQILLDFFPGFIMVARRKGNFEKEPISVMEAFHGKNWRYRYLAVPLDCLPLPLARGYYFCFRCVRKAMRLLGGNSY